MFIKSWIIIDVIIIAIVLICTLGFNIPYEPIGRILFVIFVIVNATYIIIGTLNLE